MLVSSMALCLALYTDAPDAGHSTTPRLVVAPNRSTILQRDHLPLLALVKNPGKTDIRIMHRQRTSFGEYVRFEVRDGDTWRSIRTMNDLATNLDGAGYGSANPERGRAILARSTYAELPVLLRDGGSFLFEKPGHVELRGVVFTHDGKLVSESITIAVLPRSAEDLRRIEAASKVLHYLELKVLEWVFPQKLTALVDTGGNIAQTLDNTRVLQEYVRSGSVDGVRVATDTICDTLKGRLDGVNFNLALDRLAEHGVKMRGWELVRNVIAAQTYDSFRREEALRAIRRLNDPTAAEGKTRRDLGDNSDEPIESD